MDGNKGGSTTGGAFTPISPAELAAWFGEAGAKGRRLPTEADVRGLADSVNLHIRIVVGPPLVRHAAELVAANRHVRAALPHLKKAHAELAAAFAIIDAIPDPEAPALLPEMRALLQAAGEVLQEHPPAGRGQPERHWDMTAPMFAPDVQKVMRANGRANASVSHDNAVGAYVVSKIVHRITGENVDRATVARVLRSHENAGE